MKPTLCFGIPELVRQGLALALGLGDEVYAGLRDSLQGKRDLLCSALEASGLQVARPSGTYFVIADAAPLGAVDGLEFARRLPQVAGDQADAVPRLGRARRVEALDDLEHLTQGQVVVAHVGPAGIEPTTFAV